MKNLRILAAATLFALTSIAMLAGCGDTNSEDGKVCAGQDECASGYVCVEYDKDAKKGKCRVDCASDADKTKADPAKCTDKSQVCTAHGTKFGCSAKAGGGPGQQEPECSATKACQDNTKVCDVAAGKCVKSCASDPTVCKADLQTCGSDGLCEDVRFYSLAIVDVSQATDAACTGSNKQDAGADIVAISLSAGVDKTAKAWAKGYSAHEGTVEPTGSANGKPYYKGRENDPYPDGAPQSPTGQCIIDGLSGHVDQFTSIGCGGSLLVNFMDATNRNDMVPFTIGEQVTVFEFSSNQCSGASGVAEDKYDVYACQKNSILAGDIQSECIKISGNVPLEGYASFKIGE